MKDTDIEKKENNVKESADKKVKPDSNVPKPKLDKWSTNSSISLR